MTTNDITPETKSQRVGRASGCPRSGSSEAQVLHARMSVRTGSQRLLTNTRPILPKPKVAATVLLPFPFGVHATEPAPDHEESCPRSRGHTTGHCVEVEGPQQDDTKKRRSPRPHPANGATTSKNQAGNRDRPGEAPRILLC